MILSRLRPLIFLFLIALAGGANPPAATAKDEWSGVERIVAIGDVHGDFEQLVTLLRQAGLIDKNENWIGGDTHLVQTGDVPDRGPDTRKAMDLLMKLEQQARKQKGYVHALIGNHEAMNVYGDLRYIHAGEYAAFRSKNSANEREKAYKRHLKTLEDDPPAEGLPSFDEAYRQAWFDARPLGYFEHRKAFHPPAGKYGRWIAKHNAVIKVNNTLFLHGGISAKYANRTIRDINKQARAELADRSLLLAGLLTDPQGPLWYRGLAENPEESEAANVAAVLANYGVKRIVVGHSYRVTGGAVTPRFNGKVVIIDVGLSRAYGARLACLLIENGKPIALHRGKRLHLPSDRAGLRGYLRKAAALDPQPSPLAERIDALE